MNSSHAATKAATGYRGAMVSDRQIEPIVFLSSLLYAIAYSEKTHDDTDS